MKYLFTIIGLVLIAKVEAQIPEYISTDGLICWFPFNGNTLDESFNGNNGTVQGGVSLAEDRFDNDESAQMFDGVSLTHINAGNDPMLTIDEGESLTISTWVNYTTVSSQRVILSKNGSNNNNVLGSYTLWLNNGIPKFTISNEGGIPDWYVTASGQDVLGQNTWYFITGIIDFENLEIRLLVNGNTIDTQPWGGTIDNNEASNLLLGCHYKANFGQQYEYNLHGKIDDVGLWKRVLNQCEIVELYTAGMLAHTTQSADQLFANQTGATYQWLDCDNNNTPINGETNQFFAPDFSGNFAVEVSVNGCSAISDCM
ncbi:MAG: LamG domain-containing protein, partial [Bacteroidetes bacterium]|nr:LamG domain-containing protein [Bacteroidota bacterium]